MIKPQIVNKLKSINELLLLTHLMRLPEWNHNKHTREKLAVELDMAEITLKVILKTLLTRGYIEKVSRGIYKINKEVLQ